MPVQVPETIANINRDAVNNDKKHREELIACVETLGDMIFTLKEKFKDTEYQQFYEELTKLYELRNAIKTTIIYQVIQHKHKIDRKAKEKPKTEEEKIKQGYKRCSRCDALLKNDFSLQEHRKRNICKKVFVIKETEGITAKPKGATTFTKSKLKHKKNTFALFTSFNDNHRDYVRQFKWIDDHEGYEAELRDNVEKEKQRNTSIQEGGIAGKVHYGYLRTFTTYQGWKFRNM